jgi:hypothetical protein
MSVIRQSSPHSAARTTDPLLVTREIIVSKSRINIDDMIRSSFRQDRMTPRFGILDIFLDKGDIQYFLLFVTSSTRNSRDSTMEQRVVLLENGRFGYTLFCLFASYI